MICYPEHLTEIEISAIEYYWLLSEESLSEFCYTIQQIDDYYKSEDLRPVSFLIKNSCFSLDHPAFICKKCNKRIPAKNRTDYKSRIKSDEEVLCSDCFGDEQKIRIADANKTLNEYKDTVFKSVADLESLNIEESLILLSITTEHAQESNYLCGSFEGISITGVQSIDQKYLLSLIKKNALIYIQEIPVEVQKANAVIYGNYNYITYYDQSESNSNYRVEDSITPGIYLNQKVVNSGLEVTDLSSIVFQHLQASNLSINDIDNVRLIIKEIQLDKLYRLVLEVSKEFKIAIDNSNQLKALLNHLAENYSPHKLHFTFRAKALETIEYIHKNQQTSYRSKHYFTKFVGNYIQYIEDKEYELLKSWTLPPEIQASSFEALFSHLYLNDHFDFNKLSTKDVISLWVENCNLSEEIQELIT